MARRAKDDPNAPELNVTKIVSAAVDLIDAKGLDAFSLRALARHIGAGNMSIYHYVRDREELLTLVLDEIFGTINLERLAPDDPIAALATLSERFVAAFAHHPDTIPLFVLQPVYSIGPNALIVFDRFVGLLRETGLPDDTVAEATIVLLEYLCGHLTGHLPQVQLHHSDHRPTIDEVIAELPDGAAPNISAVGPSHWRAASTSQPSAGIHLFLDGLRTQIATSQPR